MHKTRIILFIFLILIFIQPNNLVAETAPDVKISKLETKVDFPEKITFSFQGEVNKKLQDIKVNFKIGDRKTLQYGYMEFSENLDNNVVNSFMDFRINTQNGFIPPGSRINWYLTFYFEDGSQFISEDTEFVMLDTRFDDWDFLETDKIRIYYRFSKSRAKRLLEECEIVLNEMEPIVGSSEELITITLYNNYSEMIDAIRSKSKTSDRELITAGQAFENEGVVLVLAGKNDLGTSTHEIMHILVGRATDGSINLPLWLNEGLAEFANRDKTVSYDIYLDWAIGTNQLKPLSQLLTFPGNPQLTLVSYGQSRSVVNYMIDQYGFEKMNLLLSNLSKGLTVDESIINTYGINLQELDNQWRKTVGAGDYQPRENKTITILKKNPISDSSFRPSNWIIISLGLIFLGYLFFLGTIWLRDRDRDRK